MKTTTAIKKHVNRAIAPILIELYVCKTKKDQAICLVDIGEFYTELIIVRKKTLVFSRKIPITGKDFTKAMTKVLVSDRGKTELSLEQAEKIKCEVGIPPEGESKIIDNVISTTQILSMLRPSLEQLASEIGLTNLLKALTLADKDRAISILEEFGLEEIEPALKSS